jgi:hypothetical protein
MTLPTNNPSAEHPSSSRDMDLWIGQPGNPTDVPGPDMADIPSSGTGDWADFYKKIRDSSSTQKLQNYDESLGSQTSVLMFQWGTLPKNILVEDLYGCTAIIGVSHKGRSSPRYRFKAYTI